jgi:hypothetical protein
MFIHDSEPYNNKRILYHNSEFSCRTHYNIIRIFVAVLSVVLSLKHWCIVSMKMVDVRCEYVGFMNEKISMTYM